MENTCVSLSCPFIHFCKHYNFLVDRGEKCSIQEDIVTAAKRYEKNERKKRRMQT